MVAYCFCLILLFGISPSQNSRHFADNISKCIPMDAKFGISIQISLKYVHKGLIDNKPLLV